MTTAVQLSTRKLHCLKGLKWNHPYYFLQSRACSEFSIDKQKVFLSQIPGGSVELVKDESTGIATVVLNHAERKNALSGKMMTELLDIVTDLESWKSGRGVILHGANGTFCSGGDLTLMRGLINHERGGPNMSKFMQHTMTRFFNLPLVTLAYLEGRALGGGAELAVSCDLRVMTNQAQIGFVQCALGLSPGWGGGAKVVELLGRTTALKLLASASVLSSTEALDIGLIDKVVSSKAEAVEYLKTFTQPCKSTEVLQAAKRVIVNGTSEISFEEMMKRENKIFEQIWGGPAHLKALSDNKKFTKEK